MPMMINNNHTAWKYSKISGDDIGCKILKHVKKMQTELRLR